jgi:hypothetical protein
MAFTHLLWIPAGAAVGFLASFVFGDLVTLPLDLYYLIYFVISMGFLTVYIRRSRVDLRRLASRRLRWAILAGIVVGIRGISDQSCLSARRSRCAFAAYGSVPAATP